MAFEYFPRVWDKYIKFTIKTFYSIFWSGFDLNKSSFGAIWTERTHNTFGKRAKSSVAMTQIAISRWSRGVSRPRNA